MKFTKLETDALKWLLDGEHEVLKGLRNQLALATIKSRKMTGVGFYLYFKIPITSPSLLERFPTIPRKFVISDVTVKSDSLENGGGLNLWVIEGYIKFLEGAAYGGNWPENVGRYVLEYDGGPKRDIDELINKWA